MKKTIIIITGILVFSLSSIVGQSSTNEKHFFNNVLLVYEKDPGLDIEAWMVDDDIWSEEKTFSIVEDRDCELKLEPWMIKSVIW